MRDEVLELCEDLWEEHEAVFYRMALKRSSEFARAVCSDELELCDEPMPLEQLFAYEPGAARRKGGSEDDDEKEEL